MKMSSACQNKNNRQLFRFTSAAVKCYYSYCKNNGERCLLIVILRKTAGYYIRRIIGNRHKKPTAPATVEKLPRTDLGLTSVGNAAYMPPFGGRRARRKPFQVRRPASRFDKMRRSGRDGNAKTESGAFPCCLQRCPPKTITGGFFI